jgi:beta-lactamase regulating signal transducer with metallopeptidase domain
MTAINEMLQQPFGQAIGWALLQFVWQGTLIALLTAALLTALRRSGPDVRYVVSTIALALMLTVPVVTVVHTVQTMPGSAPVWEGRSPAPTAAVASSDAEVAAPPSVSSALSSAEAAPALAIPASWSVDEWLPVFVSLWLAGVVLLTLRLFSGWMWVQRMKSHGARPAPEALQSAARRLMRQLHIGRAVRLLESTSVAVPTVIGWLKPVVLLPASALAGLAPSQMEAILAHELAHIRRHDYIVNLFQTVVETLLFYHPAVWWVSRRIRAEREHCCDDLAVSLCGDPVAYAAALAELEGLRSTTGDLVLAATGGSLLQRVRRLLGAPTHAGRAPGWLAAAVALLVVISMSAGAVARDALTGEPQAPFAVPAAPVAPAVPPQPASPRPVVAAADALVPPTAIAAVPPSVPVSAQMAIPAEPAPIATTPIVPVPVAALAEPSPAWLAAPAAPVVLPSTPFPVAVPPVPVPAPVLAALPAVETPVVAQAAAAASTQSTSRTTNDGEKSGNYVWSNDGQKLEVNYRGDIEFTADDTDVSRLSPGGYLRIKDGRRSGTENSVEFQAASNGAIERRFWVSGRERPFDPEARKWLAEVLPKFIRQSGIGATARVVRFMRSGGAGAVLAEITRIEGSWAKRVYFNALFNQPGLSGATIQQTFQQAGREVDSDFELASLLISSNGLLTDDGSRRACLEAARTIGSDFEMRRVLSSIVKAGPMTPAIAALLLDTSAAIDSDFEEASLLSEFAVRQQLDGPAGAAFFKALAGVSSSFEHNRVLKAVLQRTDLSEQARVGALESGAAIESDFEAASFLTSFVKSSGVEGAARAPFFRAAASIDSAFERGRVLQALLRRTDLSEQTVLEIVRSAQTVTSAHERAQVLLAVAGAHSLTREARDAYIDAADKLGDYEQGRVLSALVRNERQK